MKVSRTPGRLARLPLALAALVPFALSAQPAALKETVVTATRFPEPARPLPFGVSVITAQEIERSGAATINEALMRILGIVGRQDLFGGGEYNLDLRGFGATADNNQVIIVDGVRLSESDLGGTRLAGIPIESVERIEVLRGSGAVLYGEGATAGVIVVTTKAGAGVARPAGASVYAGAGSFRTRELRADANMGGVGGGLMLDASAQKRKSDNHRDNFRSDLDAAAVTGQWLGESGRVGLRVSQEDLDTGLPGALTRAQFDADPRQTTTPNDFARIRGERVGAFGELQLGEWQLAMDVSQREKTLRSENSGFPFDYDIDADNASLRARHAATFGGFANALVAGFDFASWERNVLGAFGTRGTQTNRGVYVKDDLTLPAGTRLSAGWRTERVRKETTAAPDQPLADRLNAWDLGASHPVLRDVTAYVRVGRSFRLANVDEFSFTLPGVQLRPQTSRDTEVGARWVHAGGSVEARLFRSELTDEIGFDPDALATAGATPANLNFDPTRREGLEVDAAHALSPTLALRLNAAVRRATFRSGRYAGNDVPLVPRRTMALRAEWVPAAQHRVTGGLNWVSSQHPDFANTCSMPSYTTADLRYAYEWRNAEFSLGAANLFDRKYFTQAFRCAGGEPSAIFPEPGRAVTAAVRVRF
ncbi:TonB-dependent receptor [Ramlibacter henchirensis]|uniref:TonB-dependent receptor n=1 Tax=Ramlibacter henchirensis TaxID=204072 RepID=A0A4Z0C497_9BURK|nr:TonB-dependent receptor [Ramlibacter henchirensis]TFZ06363.1 TonB-dependent receptor [Ramlibacter henchirensis]